jgi:hypothetical protein
MSVHKPEAALIAHRTRQVPDTLIAVTPGQIPLPTRHFDLPPLLHGATLGLFLAYLGVMGTIFAEGRIGLVMAICAIVVTAAFAVPAKFSTMKPAHAARPLSLSAFARDGIDCMTGRVTAAQASVQVLILPVLILLWGIAIAVIVGTVG